MIREADDARQTVVIRIAQRLVEAAGIVSLKLVGIDGEAVLPPFEPGAHVDVYVADGLIRQYSLCNDPAERSFYRLAVLLDARSRGGSRGVHAGFAEGRLIRIGLPRNQFRLVPKATRSLLIAGGIGVTPLLAMAYALAASGAAFQMHYCTRSAAYAAFLHEMSAAPFAGRVDIHHDDGPAAQRFTLDRDLPAPDSGTHLYVCGPAGFMDFVIDGALSRGWAQDNIHKEHFGADIGQAGDAFVVEARRSGKTTSVPAGITIAAALADIGIDVPLACEQGVCGTCLTRVIEGRPDHRDTYQTDEEHAANGHITPCCSRALSDRLVLDL